MPSAEDVGREDRVPRTGAAALALRLAGAGYDEVADALGMVSAEAARVAAEQTLAHRAWQDSTGREKMRQENSARLERLLRSVWTKATNPADPEHLPAVRAARELIDRHCKLWGLDAPSEIVVHAPTQSEIESWVAGVVSERRSSLSMLEAPVVEASAS